MVGGSAALGLAFAPLTPMAPMIGGLGGIAIGTALGYGRAMWRLVPASLAIGTVLIASHEGAMSGPAPSNAVLVPMFGAIAAAMGVGLTTGLRGWKALATLAVAAVTTLVAVWVSLRFDHAAKLQSWPHVLRAALSASAMGIVGVVAMLPRHLSFSMDPVAAAVRKLPAKLDAEVKELCTRSVTIWTSSKAKLSDRDPGLNLVRDGVLKTLEVAVKSAQVESGGGASKDEELAKRAADLEARIAAATDAEVKAQYEAARGAVGDQQRYREQIKNNRERLVARMHNHVAALEKFHMAATGLEASRAAGAASASVKQLEELSHDVATSGEALAELEIVA